VVHRTDVARDGTVVGQILGQSPKAGTSLAEHQTLALLVSTGPPPVTVPTNLAGMPLVAATSALQAAQLAVGPLTYQYDETHAKDVVLGLAGPQPAQLPKGSKVPLVVSNGPKPRVVPSTLVGASVATATANLAAIGLQASQTSKSSTTVAAGLVLDSSPAAGTSVPRGSTVNLIVSSGPPTVVIPTNVVGMSVAAAVAALQGAGLTVSGVQGNPVGTVTGTTPGVGTTVLVGSSVVLITH